MKRTHLCKICFSPVNKFSAHSLFNRVALCDKCFAQFKPRFSQFDLDGYQALNIYEYDEFGQNLLYRYKGCFDYELNTIFLNRFRSYLFLRFLNYYIVPVPSHPLDDEERGFNHVVEIFKNLPLKMIKCVEKIQRIKQSSLNIHERKNINGRFKVVDGEKITNKRVLIVDDVMTSGETLRNIIRLLKEYHPKKIKILVVYKVNKRDD